MAATSIPSSAPPVMNQSTTMVSFATRKVAVPTGGRPPTAAVASIRSCTSYLLVR